MEGNRCQTPKTGSASITCCRQKAVRGHFKTVIENGKVAQQLNNMKNSDLLPIILRNQQPVHRGRHANSRRPARGKTVEEEAQQEPVVEEDEALDPEEIEEAEVKETEEDEIAMTMPLTKKKPRTTTKSNPKWFPSLLMGTTR